MTGSPTLPSTAATIETVARLLDRCRVGDRDAFTRLFDLTAPRLLGLVSRVVGPGPAAEGVTAGVYEAIWRGEERPARGDSLPWLVHLAHRAALEDVRTRVPSQRGREQDSARPPFPPDRRWLPGLTPVERQALSLVYLQGHTHDRADDRLGLPSGSTLANLHSAMLHLARLHDDGQLRAEAVTA